MTILKSGMIGVLLLMLATAIVAFGCGGSSTESDESDVATATAPPAAAATSAPAAAKPTAAAIATATGEDKDLAPTPTAWDGGEEIAATLLESEITAIGASGLSGSLTVVQIDRKTKFDISLDDPGSGLYTADVRRGSCPDPGEEPGGQYDYRLFDVVDGESVSMVNAPTQIFQFSAVYVIIESEDGPVACGNVPSLFR